MEKIVEELDKTVRLPGLANLQGAADPQPHRHVSTGIKSPIGIKVSGTNLADIDAIAEQIEVVARTVPGYVSVSRSGWSAGATSTLIFSVRRRPAGMTVGDVQLFCFVRHRRRDGRRNGRGRRALSDQHPLPAELSR